MNDVNNPLAQGYFFAGSDPATLKMREKIALAQMVQKRKIPTNLGEGIYSAADSIAEALSARSLMDADRAAQLAASKSTPADASEITPLAPAPPITPQAGAPSSVTAAPIAPVRSTEQSIVPAAPAVPAPPDIPGVTRLSSDAQLKDFRAQNPMPVPPPPVAPVFRPPPGTVGRAPAGGEVTANAPPSAATFGDRFGAAFPNRAPPVIAAGGDAPPPDARNDAAMALMNQQKPPPTPQPMPQPPSMAPGLGIQKAPPPGQPAAITGYVPPPLSDPTEATVVKPSKRELQLQSEINKNQGNPYYAGGADAVELAKLVEERSKKQAFEDLKTKAAVERATKREEQRQGALIGQDKSVLESQRSRLELGDLPAKLADEAEKRRLELKKARTPETRQDVETGLTYNDQTGQWEQPKIAGAGPDTKPAFKGNEFQGKALINYGRAKIAHEGLRGDPENVLSSSPLQSGLSAIPLGAGRWARSDVYKEAETHAENFVQAFIRQQSGGAYGKEELEQEARGMLPRLGDTPKQLETKREQREQFLSGMYSVIGSAGQKGSDIDAARREAVRAAAAAAKPTAAADSNVPSFANEADAIAAKLPSKTRIRIGGRMTQVP